MRRSILRLSAAVFALVFVFGALTIGSTEVHAQAPASQVNVTKCFVPIAGFGSLDTVAAEMNVTFTNTSPKIINSIVLRAQTPAGTIDFSAAGVFSPGVAVERRLQYRGSHFRAVRRVSLEVSGPAVCSVIEASFADGTSWKSPDRTPASIDIPTPPNDPSVTVPASYDNPAHNPIGIVSCQFTEFTRYLWAQGRAYGYVRFRNLSPKPIDAVVIRAFFGPAGIDFANKGAFAPNVDIRVARMERRDLPPNAFSEYETLDAPTSCVAVSVHYSDGTTWQNPSVSATEPAFPVTAPASRPQGT